MRIKTPVDLGLLIRERRRALGLDQRALATLVGVSRQWIVEVEGGKPRASVGLLLRTLTALRLDLSVANQQPARTTATTKATKSKASQRAIPAIDLDAVIDRARGRKA